MLREDFDEIGVGGPPMPSRCFKSSRHSLISCVSLRLELPAFVAWPTPRALAPANAAPAESLVGWMQATDVMSALGAGTPARDPAGMRRACRGAKFRVVGGDEGPGSRIGSANAGAESRLTVSTRLDVVVDAA